VTEKPQEPKQKTPKGLEIPVPKRKDVMGALKKAASPSVAPSADHYLRDLGFLVRERALKAKSEAESDPNDFTRGQLLAFHEIVSLMQSQAQSFAIPLGKLSLDKIDPDRDLL
jgi:hypothetical protein